MDKEDERGGKADKPEKAEKRARAEAKADAKAAFEAMPAPEPTSEQAPAEAAGGRGLFGGAAQVVGGAAHIVGGAVQAVGSVAKQPVASLDRLVARGGDAVWGELKRHPYVGVAAAGGIGIALGSVVGVGQIALGVLAGYAAYQMLTKKEPPSKAFRPDAGQGQEAHV